MMWYDNDGISFTEVIIIMALSYILFAALFLPLIYLAYLYQNGASA